MNAHISNGHDFQAKISMKNSLFSSELRTLEMKTIETLKAELKSKDLTLVYQSETIEDLKFLLEEKNIEIEDLKQQQENLSSDTQRICNDSLKNIQQLFFEKNQLEQINKNSLDKICYLESTNKYFAETISNLQQTLIQLDDERIHLNEYLQELNKNIENIEALNKNLQRVLNF